MASSIEVETTAKGFKILTLGITEVFRLGGCGICDSCNSAALTGKYIGVLNRWYCQPCFDKWHGRANYYQEDASYEAAKIEETLSILS